MEHKNVLYAIKFIIFFVSPEKLLSKSCLYFKEIFPYINILISTKYL